MAWVGQAAASPDEDESGTRPRDRCSQWCGGGGRETNCTFFLVSAFTACCTTFLSALAAGFGMVAARRRVKGGGLGDEHEARRCAECFVQAPR